MVRPLDIGSYITQLLGKRSNGASSRLSDLIEKKSTISNTEKHINDHKKGRGYITRDTAKDIDKTQRSVANRLSSLDPNSYLAYGSFLGSLSYGQRARYVQGVDRAVETTNNILKNL